MEAAGFAGQMKRYFGILPGQTISDFMRELKALDADDRAEFTRMLNEAGYPVTEAARAS